MEASLLALAKSIELHLKNAAPTTRLDPSSTHLNLKLITGRNRLIANAATTWLPPSC